MGKRVFFSSLFKHLSNAGRVVLSASGPLDITREERKHFAEHSTKIMARRLPLVAVSLAIAAFVFWPTDWLFWPDNPERTNAHSEFRVVCLILIVIFNFVMFLSKWAKSHPVFLATLFIDFGVFAVSWIISGLPEASSQLFSLMYFISCFAIFGLMDFKIRVIVTTSISASAFTGFFLADLTRLNDPFLGSMISQLLFGTGFSIALGWMIQNLACSDFVNSFRLQDKMVEVESLKDNLQERVAEQTNELRALMNRLDHIAEQERIHLSREIHDQLGQDITTMRYALALAQGRFAESEAAPSFAELNLLLERTNESLRRIITRLRPQALEQLGFVAAVRWLFEDRCKNIDLQPKFSISPEDLTVPTKAGAILYHIAQEGLTNVIRHAHASLVELSLELHGDILKMCIKDNGKGFEEKAEKTGLNIGMIGVRERVAALGGKAHWRTRSQGGIVLEVTVPFCQKESVEEA